MNIVERILDGQDIRKSILEAKSAPLYHGTYLEDACRAIIQDEILGITDQEIKDVGPKSGVSLTRDLRFAQKWKGQAVLVLDQEKLASNLKLMPLNRTPGRNRLSSDHESEEFVPDWIRPLSRYLIKVIFNENVIDYWREDFPDEEDFEFEYSKQLEMIKEVEKKVKVEWKRW